MLGKYGKIGSDKQIAYAQKLLKHPSTSLQYALDIASRKVLEGFENEPIYSEGKRACKAFEAALQHADAVIDAANHDVSFLIEHIGEGRKAEYGLDRRCYPGIARFCAAYKEALKKIK